MLRRDGALARSRLARRAGARGRAAGVQAAACWSRRACPTRRSGSCEQLDAKPAGGAVAASRRALAGARRHSEPGAVQTHRARRPGRLDELPVLALWIRRAVLSGARLVVLGAENGLWRDTTHWLPSERVADLTAALLGGRADGKPRPTSARQPRRCAAPSPAALLVHPHLVACPSTRSRRWPKRSAIDPRRAWSARRCSAPTAAAPRTLAPVDREPDHAQELAIGCVAAAARRRSLGRARHRLRARGARHVETRTRRCPRGRGPADGPPVRAPGSITNLEGRVQQQDGGAAPPPRARAGLEHRRRPWPSAFGARLSCRSRPARRSAAELELLTRSAASRV